MSIQELQHECSSMSKPEFKSCWITGSLVSFTSFFVDFLAAASDRVGGKDAGLSKPEGDDERCGSDRFRPVPTGPPGAPSETKAGLWNEEVSCETVCPLKHLQVPPSHFGKSSSYRESVWGPVYSTRKRSFCQEKRNNSTSG